MTNIKRWMYPSYYMSGNNVYITFLTSNGKRHHIKCKPNDRLQRYTFRFRNSTWLAVKYSDIAYQN